MIKYGYGSCETLGLGTRRSLKLEVVHVFFLALASGMKFGILGGYFRSYFKPQIKCHNPEKDNPDIFFF